jgi:hypothetical protein
MPFCHIPLLLCMSDMHLPIYRCAAAAAADVAESTPLHAEAEEGRTFSRARCRPSLPHPFAIFLLLGDGFSGGAAAQANLSGEDGDPQRSKTPAWWCLLQMVTSPTALRHFYNRLSRCFDPRHQSLFDAPSSSRAPSPFFGNFSQLN